jgi:prepilin-type N-terminal cleavage/methylation domain-containing protein
MITRGRAEARLRRGVTLIEMLIVVTVLGIAAAITYSRIDTTAQQLRGDMQMLASSLTAAQREALAKQHNVIVIFDTVDMALQIVLDANNNRGRDEDERVRTVTLGNKVVFARGSAPARSFGASPLSITTVVDAKPAIIFSRNGAASTSGGLYLSTRRAIEDPARFGEETHAISIERATGSIGWWSFAGLEWRRLQ